MKSATRSFNRSADDEKLVREIFRETNRGTYIHRIQYLASFYVGTVDLLVIIINQLVVLATRLTKQKQIEG